jgi:hypothetical protein
MLDYRLMRAVVFACVILGGHAALAQGAASPRAASDEGQATSEADQNLQDFDFVVEKLRLNYAGWDAEVTAETRPALDALTARLRRAAQGASQEQLTALLQEWTRFFGDGHVSVSPLAAPAPAGGSSGAPASTPSLAWNEAGVRAELAARGARRDPLEGIWRIDGDRYRLGVLPSPGKPGSFAAVVLSTTSGSWKPGQVKAELTRKPDGALAILYRAGDHGEHPTGATLLLDGAALSVEGWGHWVREAPAIPDAGLVERALPGSWLFMKALSPDTLWLRIPDFNESRAKPLRDLLTENAAALASSKNLVIDLRNNGGGSDFVYEPLTPLLYSRPIYLVGVEMRASADNIALRKQYAEKIRTEAPEIAAFLDRQAARMSEKPGAFVPGDDAVFEVKRLETVLPFPKRVAILVDNAASTGEQFLLEARQSRKVTLFGKENSAGVLDFANVVGMPTPSGRFQVSWATSRSMRLPGDPVDPDGIAPDIRIPADEADPVAYAQRWLERQVD